MPLQPLLLFQSFLSARNYPDKLPKDFLSSRFKALLPAYISIGLIFAILFSANFKEFLHNAFRYIVLADSIAYFIIIILQFSLLHYLIHTIPMNLIAFKLSNYFWMNVILLFMISITLSILTSKLLNKSKLGYLIVGKQMIVRK